MDAKKEPTIMVVDDDADLLFMMKAALERDGFKVNARSTPPNWIELGAIDPDLIFMDVNMPPRNGASVCKAIKENMNRTGPAIVLISAHAADQLEKEARISHADAFLTKPFSHAALKQLAHRYVRL